LDYRVTIIVALLAFSLSNWARAQDCSGQRTVVDRLRARVKADQSQIQRLNPTLTANELDRWANAAEQERQQILKKSLVSAISTLADGMLSAPENVLKPMNLAGHHLPRGIGSLGTAQALVSLC